MLTECRVPIKAKGDFSQLFYSFSRDISCDPETLLFINTAHVTMTTDRQKLPAAVQATGASYFVIKFSEDQCIFAIPSKRIVEPAAGALATGDSCVICWTGGCRYETKVLEIAQDYATAKPKPKPKPNSQSMESLLSNLQGKKLVPVNSQPIKSLLRDLQNQQLVPT